MKQLLENILTGDVLSIARAISWIENKDPRGDVLSSQLFKYTGNAYRIGITGPPGAGKSTITGNLARLFLKHQYKVGIIAVDPTSPFTGGAILGDRVRMMNLANEKNIFIRSMATRGSLGGLAEMTNEAGDILDAAGFNVILFETVGVGQTELDVASAADTTVVVLVPESGDAIQTMKAGLMEIADIFVVNKSDREGSTRLATELEMMLRQYKHNTPWEKPIIKCIAYMNQGIDDLFHAIMKHRSFLEENGLLHKKREKRLQDIFNENLKSVLFQKFKANLKNGELQALLKEIYLRKKSVHQVVEELLKKQKGA